jgi:serine/threonine protein kinase
LGHLIAVQRYGPWTLADRLAIGPLTLEEAYSAGAAVAAGLEAGHKLGLAHADIRPDAIFFETWSGAATRIRISAFLGGTLADADDLAGEAFRALEVRHGAAPDARSDLWALGALLRHSLAGDEVAVDRPLVPDHIGEPLRGILTRCLQPDPSARPASAGEVVKQFENRRVRHGSFLAASRSVQLAVGFALLCLLLAIFALCQQNP